MEQSPDERTDPGLRVVKEADVPAGVELTEGRPAVYAKAAAKE